MTTRERVHELLDFAKTNPPVEQVYERFYDENVIVQENLNPPRQGRAISIERQQKINTNVKEVREFSVGAVLVDGDRSVIEMTIDVITQDGYHIHIEELSMQTWKNGYIVQERFFYDPINIQGLTKELNEMR